jgi:hypothetical protein
MLPVAMFLLPCSLLGRRAGQPRSRCFGNPAEPAVTYADEKRAAAGDTGREKSSEPG